MSIVLPPLNAPSYPGNGNIIINISQAGRPWGQLPQVTVNGTPVALTEAANGANTGIINGNGSLSPQPYAALPGQPSGQALNAVSSGIPAQLVITPEMQRQQALNALQPDIQNVQYAYQVAMQKRQEAEVARMTYMTLANDVNNRIQMILNNSINAALPASPSLGTVPQLPLAASMPLTQLDPNFNANGGITALPLPYGNTYAAPLPPAMVGMPNTPIQATPIAPALPAGSPFPNAVPTEQLPALPTDPGQSVSSLAPATPAEASVATAPAPVAPAAPPAPTPTTGPAPVQAPAQTPAQMPAPVAAEPAPAAPAPDAMAGVPQQLSDFPLYKKLSQQATPQLQGLLRDILSIPNAQGQVNQLSDPSLYSLQTIEFILFILRNRPDAASGDTYSLLKQLKDMGLVMATLKDPSIDDWKKKDSEVILMESLWAAAKLDSFQPPNTPLAKLQGYNSLIKPILDGTETVPPLITMAAVQAISPDMFARYNEIPADTLNKLQARLSKAIANSGSRKWSTLGLSKYPTLTEEDKAIYTQTIQLAEMVKRGQSLSSLPGVVAGPAGVQGGLPNNSVPTGTPINAPLTASAAATLPGMPPLSPAEVDSLMQSLPPDQRQAIETMANDLLANTANGLPPKPPSAPSGPVAATNAGLPSQPALNVAG